jgi:sugar lactone lactonase YvrE
MLAALATALLVSAARADVKPHPLFSDGMVLQQGADCRVWGTADPGEDISGSWESGGAVGSAGNLTPTKADKDGKWSFTLPLKDDGSPGSSIAKAGGPYTLTIKGKNTVTIKDVYVGEVWVASGQSNMEMSVNGSAGAKEAKEKAKNPKLRLFTVERVASATPQTTVPVIDAPKKQVKGKWLEAGPDTVGDFSAVGYYFGRDLQKDLDVPVGIIHASWGGTASEEWTSMKVLDAHREHTGHHPRQSQLYNGMIAPLIPYAIKGVIWYQGESNAGRAELYRSGFPLLIRNWREDWKQGDFPFLFVQLAPFLKIDKEPADTDWARLRDAQLETTRTVKNTAMAVITDVGDEKDIHPKRKAEVGHRLELAALALAYGKKDEYSGPVFDKMTVEGNKAVLSFTHGGGGLEAKDGPLTGFTVAGADRKFHNADAEIKGDTVVVWSKDVDRPAAVRYGWANYPVVNLWNKAGLPASPFRTDDWSRLIIAPGAKLQKLAGDFKFTEGPAADAEGNVYFTDQPNDRILKWGTDGKLSTFLQPCGRSNGLCFDAKGNLWACADEKNELWRIDPQGKAIVVVKDYKGKLLNGPNDIWIRPDGGMYLTDPYYKRDYWKRGPKEQDCEAVYYLAPDHKTLTRVADDLEQPNGIIGTPDGKTLYVADIKGNKTYAYDVQADGTLKNKRLFCNLGSDGMTIDDEGNVYLTGKGVTVFDKTGKQVEHIDVAEPWTANVCFGGKDRHTLFITASAGLYGLKMRTRGVGSQ